MWLGSNHKKKKSLRHARQEAFMFKCYMSDTSFIHGNGLPEQVREALNTLHAVHADGVKTAVTFNSNDSISVWYNISMSDLRKDFLPRRTTKVMSALRTLFSLKSPDWTRYSEIDRTQGVDSCRQRAIVFPDRKTTVYIELNY